MSALLSTATVATKKSVLNYSQWSVFANPHASTLQSNELRELCRHPLYLRCAYDDAKCRFSVDAGRFTCGGLIHRLKIRFYPQFKFKKTKSPYWRKGIRSSKTIGSAVDREIETLVNVRGVRSIDDSDFPKHGILSKTRRFYQRLKEMDIVPVLAEFTVVCVAKGVGTRIDLIGYRHFGTDRQRVVTVERKTGYTSGMYAAQGAMTAPLAHIKNNPFNQHQLQSLVGAILLERCYGIKVSERYVLYTDWKKDYWRPVPVAFRQPRDLVQKIWEKL